MGKSVFFLGLVLLCIMVPVFIPVLMIAVGLTMWANKND